MHFKKMVLSLLAAIIISVICAGRRVETASSPDSSEFLRVAIDGGVTGYFVVGGQNYGFSYELLRTYAQATQHPLRIIDGSRSKVKNHLREGSIDAAVMLTSKSADRELISIPLYSTNYVILAPRGKAASYQLSEAGIVSGAQDAKIMVSAGFEQCESYKAVLGAMRHVQIYISAEDGFGLAKRLSEGEYDLLVCEKSEALLAEQLIKNIKHIYEFDEEISLSLVVAKRDASLAESLENWLGQYRQTDEYETLVSIYLHKGFGGELLAINKPNRVVGGISVCDDLIRSVGEKEGVDWRLLSAIAYNESRFYSDVVSRAGAQGIMQIMPCVARQFKVEPHQLKDPEMNITIAARLLKTIEGMLKIDAATDPDDRLAIILAAYNSGVGTVMTARRLALAEGADSDSWETVSEYLVKMGDRSYLATVGSGRVFHGSVETLAFVDNVRDRYDTYSRNVY